MHSGYLVKSEARAVAGEAEVAIHCG